MKRNKKYQRVPKDLLQIYMYTHIHIQTWISYSELLLKKNLESYHSMAHIQEFLEDDGFQMFWKFNPQ